MVAEASAMKKARSPQQKKTLAYHKDRFVVAEYPHAFRRKWPRKRAYASRAYRHRVHQLLGEHKGTLLQESDAAGGERVKAVHRREVRRWGTMTLRERVHFRQWRRASGTARKYFSYPYSAERDRQRFTMFLASLTTGATPALRDVALFFADLLDAAQHASPDVSAYMPGYNSHQRPSWLRAFLRDEPEWEPRLRAWIIRVMAGDDPA
jgi:hypothetical protein